MWFVSLRRLAFLLLVFLLYTPLSAHSSNIQDTRTQFLQTHFTKVLSRPVTDPERTLRDLLSVASNPQEKAWLVYRWVTSHFKHDTRLAAKVGDPATKSLQDLMKVGGGSCAVDAEVTARLMKLAGLEVKTIYGMAKGGAASSVVNGKRVNHVWNAVNLNGNWYVVDTTWGAGFVGPYGFQRDQSDLYFMIPGELAVFTHFDESDELGYQRRQAVDQKVFSRLPSDALYMASLGFDVQEILSVARQGLGSALVQTFDQKPGLFAVTDAPVREVLPRKPQSFSIESEVYSELMVVQGKTWTPFNKNGSSYSLTITPDRGELIVMARRSKLSDFEAILAYKVR